MEIIKITVVPENKVFQDYQRGDLCKQEWAWMLKCPGCGVIATIDRAKIIEHDEHTVSTRAFLHCHGSRASQRFAIERNKVRWL